VGLQAPADTTRPAAGGTAQLAVRAGPDLPAYLCEVRGVCFDAERGMSWLERKKERKIYARCQACVKGARALLFKLPGHVVARQRPIAPLEDELMRIHHVTTGHGQEVGVHRHAQLMALPQLAARRLVVARRGPPACSCIA
jgi:hypothetical protein